MAMGIAIVSILIGCLAMYLLIRNGFRMHALSDEFEAPIALEAMLREHGADSDVPLKPATVQHLANLIRKLDHSLLVQKCVTGILAVFCIILGSATLVLMRKKESAQP